MLAPVLQTPDLFFAMTVRTGHEASESAIYYFHFCAQHRIHSQGASNLMQINTG